MNKEISGVDQSIEATGYQIQVIEPRPELKKLTPRQTETLVEIVLYQAEAQRWPTIEVLAERLQISRTPAGRLMRIVRNKGWLTTNTISNRHYITGSYLSYEEAVWLKHLSDFSNR